MWEKVRERELAAPPLDATGLACFGSVRFPAFVGTVVDVVVARSGCTADVAIGIDSLKLVNSV